MEANAQALARTFPCKRPNCTQTTTVTRGAYAFLCDEHAEIAKRENSRRISAGLGGRTGDTQSGATCPPPIRIAPTANGDPPPSLKAAAQAVVPAAAELDRALVHKRTANARARDAFDAFKQALEQLQAQAREALEARP